MFTSGYEYPCRAKLCAFNGAHLSYLTIVARSHRVVLPSRFLGTGFYKTHTCYFLEIVPRAHIVVVKHFNTLKWMECVEMVSV